MLEKKLKLYYINVIDHGSVQVEALNEDEAREKAREVMEEGGVDWGTSAYEIEIDRVKEIK